MVAKDVIDFYVLCNKLKTTIRTGWKKWNVQSDRLESVAEHVYGTQMLAIAFYLKYGYDVDILKVILMLAIHETEEIFIGDITQFDVSKEEMAKIGQERVHELFSTIMKSEALKSIIDEFNKRETREAKFAYFIDKLECDIMAKMYDDNGCIKYDSNGKISDIHTDGNNAYHDERVQKYLNEGKNFGEMWVTFGQDMYGYDDNFKEVSDYVLNNKIKF